MRVEKEEIILSPILKKGSFKSLDPEERSRELLTCGNESFILPNVSFLHAGIRARPEIQRLREKIINF